MIKFTTLLVLGIALLLTLAACERGCSDCPGETALADVKVGESLRLDSESDTIEVSFLEVVEDSRCPADADCLSAGHACVRLRIDTAPSDGSGATSQETVMQIVDDGQPDSQILNGVHVKLYYLEPVLLAGQTIPQAEYSVRMRITGSAFSQLTESPLCSAA